ncbi:MAG: hypothetical protein ACE5EC_07435, partial [Phycisphaerae bacterium]
QPPAEAGGKQKNCPAEAGCVELANGGNHRLKPVANKKTARLKPEKESADSVMDPAGFIPYRFGVDFSGRE